ncbi:hypothetical protein PVK06_043145 [Gossypium arboreum]|uniref:Uncharacterized protein n=1 Tax=Gossypium arboreum TaxID=29729 RepID=A0ABR0MMQ9_GOSAR|nr:hypothetical protein PVK06_043145 [Gossypium arboreum]
MRAPDRTKETCEGGRTRIQSWEPQLSDRFQKLLVPSSGALSLGVLGLGFGFRIIGSWVRDFRIWVEIIFGLVLSIIEDGDKGFDNEDQPHRYPNNDFSLDDILEEIDDKGPVEGENVNPHSAENTGPDIVIRNNLKSFMANVDLDAAFALEFVEYTNIVPICLLDKEFDGEELFIGQKFDNKKDCLHAIKQYSLKLGVDYNVTKSM